MSTTHADLKTRLAQMVGDANPSGAALYSKWSEAEYSVAINFAVNLIREDYLLPCTGDITWVEDTFNYAPPTGGTPASEMVYLYEIRARRGVTNTEGGVARTPEVYEVEYPLDWVSVQRDADNTLKIHFDENSIKGRGLNVSDLVLRVQGYRYQGEDQDVEIPWSVVALIAKQFLHLSGEGRDPNAMMKNLRQWQAAAQMYHGNRAGDIEVPGGFWLTV